MIKVLGAVLVWGGCALCGMRAAQQVRRRVRFLEDMGQAMELLERELSLNRAALPELLELLSNRATQQGKMVFCSCKSDIEKGNSFIYAWGKALEQAGLKEEERTLLSCLAQVLGRYDAQGQGQAMAHLRQELERRTARSREEARSLARVYSVLGVTAGGFLTLALL